MKDLSRGLLLPILLAAALGAGASAQTRERWEDVDLARETARLHTIERPIKPGNPQSDSDDLAMIGTVAALIAGAFAWELARQRRHENQWRRHLHAQQAEQQDTLRLAPTSRAESVALFRPGAKRPIRHSSESSLMETGRSGTNPPAVRPSTRLRLPA
jgi:hypothetical protein